jgi:hypothetical protein
MKLRMVPAGDRFRAGDGVQHGRLHVLGQPIKQPRWLKAFERPDPNLYLDDDKAAEEYHAGLSPDSSKATWPSATAT